MIKTGIKLLIFLCRGNKELTENKGKTLSRGTNSRFPFGVKVNLNLSILWNGPRREYPAHSPALRWIIAKDYIFWSMTDAHTLRSLRRKLKGTVDSHRRARIMACDNKSPLFRLEGG